MKYAFAARPGVFDLNSDGYADVFHFSDLGGKPRKWAIMDLAGCEKPRARRANRWYTHERG